MGPIWGRQDPGGPHFGPMNIAIWVTSESEIWDVLYEFKVWSTVWLIHYSTVSNIVLYWILLQQNLYVYLEYMYLSNKYISSGTSMSI